MAPSRMLTDQEINKIALEQFVHYKVSPEMISYLALAAHNVIPCDSALMPMQNDSGSHRNGPPTPPESPDSAPVMPADGGLPSVEEFITKLVVLSNVQVPTLMCTLVYLTRLKSKLQPMARGLRCTTHRIFLAALILAAKYLNDSSPKNKHWASYTFHNHAEYVFGFSCNEVNLMELQLLFLLKWDLHMDEEDLYREFDGFLEPIRHEVRHEHIKRMRQKQRRQKEMYAAAAAAAAAASARYPSPPTSRHASPDSRLAAARAGSISPPGLTYSSSASSYASSVASTSSRQHSRSTTPLESETDPFAYHEFLDDSLYDSPVDVSMDKELFTASTRNLKPTPSSLRLEETANEQYRQLYDVSNRKRQRRGVWARLLGGGAVTVR